MQIKKIQDKLDFDVEAQDLCPDGKFRFSESCSSDCEKTTWSGLNASYIKRDKDWQEYCTSSTTYSCSTLHKW